MPNLIKNSFENFGLTCLSFVHRRTKSGVCSSQSAPLALKIKVNLNDVVQVTRAYTIKNFTAAVSLIAYHYYSV